MKNLLFSILFLTISLLALGQPAGDERKSSGAAFIPELVHNRSGAGSDGLAVDLNKDGRMDIISSANRGTFIFWNK